MDILGIGVDLVEVERIDKAIARHEGFVSRVFSLRERKRCEDCAYPGRRYAACFAAKEAASKALGTGVRGFAWPEVEMLTDEAGRPYLELSGRAEELARKRGITEILVSVSHTGDIALAVAQALGGGDRS
jgi:holo-[acyl-carrier protein] synthase